MNNLYSLRPEQKDILQYSQGKMGISAVPGSGKTFTLSLLAAKIIQQGYIKDDQEVLIVTLVNSAVENFYRRISDLIKSSNQLPNLGYRVRTLHGLAHDIVRERPEYVGLDNNFIIIDERETDLMIDQAVQAWLRTNQSKINDYLKDDLIEEQWTRLNKFDIPELVKSVAVSVIRLAKDQQKTPDELSYLHDESGFSLSLAEMGLAIYKDYQRGLTYRGGVDFDDLIRLALNILENNETTLERLRTRWPFILEDEAQDSSRLQEKILSILAGAPGNWVRVGDPNQAIYETFTTATPEYLKNFIQDPFVTAQTLPVSGRSTKSIIELANELVNWTVNEHPVLEARDALTITPKIILSPLDDPQPNPEDDPDSIWLIDNKYTVDQEIKSVAKSLAKWIRENPSKTVAALSPRNSRARELAEELDRMNVPYNDDLLSISSSTRSSAEIIENILTYLSDPLSSKKLAKAYVDFSKLSANENDTKDMELIDRTAEILRKCIHLEDYIWPVPSKNWLADLEKSIDHKLMNELESYRAVVRQWQESVLLPIDQLILTMAQNLFTNPAELAIAHKIAVLLRSTSDMHPGWRIFEFSQELRLITENKRRFQGFAEDDEGFNPDRFPGQVVLSTIHKAKGFEWDRVYLLSVNNYDFPSGLEGDLYQPEKWFIRDHLNLEAEALAQLAMLTSTEDSISYQEGQASIHARFDYIRERLRLLYVGITRARKEIVITWNTGRRGNLTQAAPFIALKEFWSKKHAI